MTPITAVVVDDEPLAREGLILRLQSFAHVEVVAECRNVSELKIALSAHKPDLVFLDIEMPGLNALEFFKRQGGAEGVHIVFVTAYSHYAVEAFNVDAVDYLVKPVKQERLQKALDKVEERIKALQAGHLIEAAQEESDPRFQATLLIKTSGKSIVVPCIEIDWIEAAGDYMCVHIGEEVHLMRSTMKELEQSLNPDLFKRVHRSVIVNIKKIKEIVGHSSGESFLVLRNGDKIKVSRSYRNKIKDFL